MLTSFCRWLLYKRLGYRFEETVKRPRKYIIALAPHTSNWDFIMALLFMGAENFQCGFMMKKEWFFWPLGQIFRKLGGIPVYRQKKSSMTDAIAESAKAEKTYHLCITPEGTRSPNPDWKKGFYFIALKAGLPILLYGIDYEKRLIQCTKTIIPSGDLENDMRNIKLYFKDFRGKIPNNFTIGDV
jgi:1-acyl-sn-glycerol-3-phosphate acyltransferase